MYDVTMVALVFDTDRLVVFC